ncbi:MAG: SIS domain-containing protein, partial [Bacteroidales bacterium]|nr:SIS domain-containing protein [Bacteroidales bacterium]
MAIPAIYNDLETIACQMIAAIKNGNCIYSCGNGGSMADAMHFAEELTGKFRETRKGLPAIAI